MSLLSEFLSTHAEWHAAVLGFYDGMRTWRVRPEEMRDNPDVDKEPHYYAGGYIAGTGAQAIIAFVIIRGYI